MRYLRSTLAVAICVASTEISGDLVDRARFLSCGGDRARPLREADKSKRIARDSGDKIQTQIEILARVAGRTVRCAWIAVRFSSKRVVVLFVCSFDHAVRH
jgi:hypothetical protein